MEISIALNSWKWVEQILGMGEDGGKFVLQQLK